LPGSSFLFLPVRIRQPIPPNQLNRIASDSSADAQIQFIKDSKADELKNYSSAQMRLPDYFDSPTAGLLGEHLISCQK
jgi:hypothetical protein